MYGAIRGLAPLYQVTTEPFTNQPRDLVRLTHVATAVRSLRERAP